METPNLGFQLIVKTKPRLAEFVLEVTNLSNQDLSFKFPTSQEFDLAVIGEGQEVWRWSGDMMFTQAFHTLVLKKGKSKSYTASWNYKTLMGEKVPLGEYILLAYFLGVSSRTEPVAEREFTVP